MRRHNDKVTVGVLTALSLAGVLLAVEKPNFTGDWNLNVARSDFAQMPAPTMSVMKIDHKDPGVRTSTTTVSERGERTVDAQYFTDGKETTNKVFGDNVIKSTARWEGTALSIEGRGNFNGNEFLMKQKWTLAVDGRTLTIVQSFDTPNGPMKTTRVFEKK